MDALEAIQKGTCSKPIFDSKSAVTFVVLGASVSHDNSQQRQTLYYQIITINGIRCVSLRHFIDNNCSVEYF